MNDRLVDFVCVRSTHQREGMSPVVTMHAGALLACPCGETVGHVWRAAVGAPRLDDRVLARFIASQGHLAALLIRPVN